MCGIVGVLGMDEKLHSCVEEAVNLLQHRGPDNKSFMAPEPFLSLGFVRLSIVDLHPRSNQPMADRCSRNIIAFNGEVYNYESLRDEFNFKLETTSDTEVLLRLITELGFEKAIKRLNGMFALAFYNKDEKFLYLCRDRIGKKPLFYTFINGNLLFTSEIKVVKAFGIKLEPEHKAVVNFLLERTLGSFDFTFFKGWHQLEAGVYKIFRLDNSVTEVRKVRYWSFPQHTSEIPYQKAKERFRELFFDSVNIRLPKEVSFATLLSGGLDSSSVTCVAAFLNPTKVINSITASYVGDKYDESSFAKEVVSKYPNIKASFINISTGMFLDVIDKVIYHQETPIADGSMVSHYLLMEEIAKKGIKVVLNGSGGDETLAGYVSTLGPAYFAGRFLKGHIVSSIGSACKKGVLPAMFFHLLPNRLKNFYKMSRYHFAGEFSFIKDKGLIKKTMFSRFQNVYMRNDDLVNAYLVMCFVHWSLPGFVWYEDRNSMAHSVDSRSPFLDYRLVEFLLSLPGEYKIGSHNSKKLLRDSLADLVPEKVLRRKDKQGFYAPIEDWIKTIDFPLSCDKDFAAVFAYIDLDRFDNLSSEYKWRLFSLYKWYKIFIDN